MSQETQEPEHYGWDWRLRTEHAQDILRGAMDRWGEPAQIDMMGEESAELSRAVHRYQNGRDEVDALVEEVVDARILMEQLTVSGVLPQSAIQDRVEERIERLEGRVMDGWDGGPQERTDQ